MFIKLKLSNGKLIVVNISKIVAVYIDNYEDVILRTDKVTFELGETVESVHEKIKVQFSSI